MFKAGLVSVSFRSLSAEEIVAAAKSNSLTHIEWGSDIHAPVSDLKGIEQIAELCGKNNISCSYGSYFRLGQTPLKELPAYLKAASVLGADVMRVWCGTKSSKEYTEGERSALCDECRRAGDLAQKAGVTLCTECHSGTLTDEKESALALFHEVNSPAFQTFWQPNQFGTAEENLAYARAIAPMTRTVHVFAWEGEKHFPLSRQTSLWKKYLSCFQQNIPCLLEFMPDGKLSSLKTEARSLFEILTGLQENAGKTEETV